MTCFEIEPIETHRGVPIVACRYAQPTLLSQETHAAEAQALLDLPHERFAVIINFANLSCCVDYGPEEMGALLHSELYRDLRTRSVACVRYGTGSLTSMVQLMSAQALLADRGSNFAPNRELALKLVRRAIEMCPREEVGA